MDTLVKAIITAVLEIAAGDRKCGKIIINSCIVGLAAATAWAIPQAIVIRDEIHMVVEFKKDAEVSGAKDGEHERSQDGTLAEHGRMLLEHQAAISTNQRDISRIQGALDGRRN